MRTAAFLLVAVLLVGGPPSPARAAAPAGPEPFLKEATADLTGTGRANHITFRVIGNPEGSGRFVLSIDKASLTDSLDVGLAGFRVLDVDGADKLKEIGVFTYGPSDDFAWAIYSFDGKAIHRMARIPGQMTLTGNGTLVAAIRGPGPLTWFYRQKYVLTKDRKLARVPQEFYPVTGDAGLDHHPSGTVRQSFPILQSRSGKAVVVQPRKGTKLTVMLWDGAKWYGVITHTGLFGWVTEDALGKHVDGLPAAD